MLHKNTFLKVLYIMGIIIICYIIILIIQFLFIYFYLDKWRDYINDDKTVYIKYNDEHKDELDKYFKEKIIERTKLLKKMEYDEWLKYNKNNSVIEYKGYKYSLFIYERVVNDEIDYLSDNTYVLRVMPNSTRIGASYADYVKQEQYSFLFSNFGPDPSLINNMFKMSLNEKDVNTISFYGLDTFYDNTAKKVAVSSKWEKGKDNMMVDGVIGIDYSIKDITNEYSTKYYNYLSIPFMVFTSISSLLISIITFYLNGGKKVTKPLLILFALNAYFTYFINISEGITSLETEDNKVKDINDGILGIAFLVAVNIFIIETMKKTKFAQKELHNETSFIFCISLILLLLSLYKYTNYNNINDVRSNRIRKQLLFNLSIFLNLFVLFDYLAYVAQISNLIQFSEKLL